MKKFKLFILAFVGCIALAACGGDGDTDDIVDPDDNTPSGIDDVHNGTSNKPAYAPAR